MGFRLASTDPHAVLKSLHSVRAERLRKLLREARTASGMTQSELASKLRRPQSFVSKFEQGERRLDVIEYLELCEALGIQASDLLGSLQRR